MSTEQDKTAAAKDVATPAASEQQGTLAHDDILSGASLVLPAVAAAGEEAVPEASDAIPGLTEVLTSGDEGFAGGLLTFDNESSPGHTIVRVTFEGDAAQNAYEVATLPGGTDINSLLGLLGHDGGHHHT